MVQAPRLQGAARYVQHLGRLTLGDTLVVQTPILRKQVSAFDARPALVTICIATVLVLDDRCHSYLLLTPCAFTSCWLRMAGELSGFNPYGCRVTAFGGVIETKWPMP